MTAANFFDTNIFLYAGSQAPEDAEKQRIASDLILNLDFSISAQVLQEFIANALGKKALGFTEANIVSSLESFREMTVLPITGGLVERAFLMRRKFQISYWDAAILAAAQELSCRTLYSEDLGHGQDYDGVRVINPFR